MRLSRMNWKKQMKTRRKTQEKNLRLCLYSSEKRALPGFNQALANRWSRKPRRYMQLQTVAPASCVRSHESISGITDSGIGLPSIPHNKRERCLVTCFNSDFRRTSAARSCGDTAQRTLRRKPHFRERRSVLLRGDHREFL